MLNYYDNEIRTALVGSPLVGKSWIIQRFLQPQVELPSDFYIDYEDSYRKQYKPIGATQPYLYDIIDTHLDEEYSAMRDRFYRSMNGIIIVYSVTDILSFEAVPGFYEQYLRVTDRDNMPAIIVANKCDVPEQDRKVTTQEGYDLATKMGLPYYEVSATKVVNIEETFSNFTNLVLNWRTEHPRQKRAKKNSLFTKKSKTTENTQDNNTQLPVSKAKLFNSPHKVSDITVPPSTYNADLQQMYADMDFADVKFVTTDNQTILAHAFVIAARCKELWNILKQNSTSDILSVNYNSVIMNVFVQHLYTEKLDEKCDDVAIRNELVALAREWKTATLLKDLYNKYRSDLTPDPSVDPPMQDYNLLTASERSLTTLNREMRRALMAPSGDKSTFDIIFNAKTPENNKKVIKAHKALLSARCAYFRAMFTGGTKERDAAEVDIDDVQYFILLSIIEYCYTDDIRYVQDDTVPDLLVGACRFCLSRLSKKMEAYILLGVTRHNVVEIYTFAREYEATDLKEKCIQIIARWTKWLTANCADFSNKNKISETELAYFEEIRSKWVGADTFEEEELRTEAATEEAQKAKQQQTQTQQTETNNRDRCVLQ